jgi:hypothetical protein
MNIDSTININQLDKMTSVLSVMFHPSDININCDCIGYDNHHVTIGYDNHHVIIGYDNRHVNSCDLIK